jgi:hypothetical protein
MDKVTRPLTGLSSSFHPLSLFQWCLQSKKIWLNLSMRAFNAQGLRVIISVVQVGTVKIYRQHQWRRSVKTKKIGWNSVYWKRDWFSEFPSPECAQFKFTTSSCFPLREPPIRTGTSRTTFYFALSAPRCERPFFCWAGEKEIHKRKFEKDRD